jgi:hypothetical protein
VCVPYTIAAADVRVRFEALVGRYEEPIEFNRWDAPLIILMPDDATPLARIHEALYERKAQHPNAANLPVRAILLFIFIIYFKLFVVLCNKGRRPYRRRIMCTSWIASHRQ